MVTNNIILYILYYIIIIVILMSHIPLTYYAYNLYVYITLTKSSYFNLFIYFKDSLISDK